MENNNYKLYKKHKADIFNMFFEAWERCLDEPKDEIIKNEKLKIYQQLKELGFDLKSTN